MRRLVETEDGEETQLVQKHYTVEADGTCCNCSVFVSKLLPCRHIISARNFLDIPLIPTSLFNERWLQCHYPAALPGQTPSQVVVSENERARLPSKLNRTQKYSLARGTLDKICGRLVALGTDKFLSYLSLLQEFELAISERRDVNIIEVERAQPMNDDDDEVDEEVASEGIEDETEVIVTQHGVEVFIRRDELETVVEEDDGEVLTVDSGSPGVLALTVAGSADVEASGSACVSTDVVASTDIAESSAAVEESAVVEVLLPGEEPSDESLSHVLTYIQSPFPQKPAGRPSGYGQTRHWSSRHKEKMQQ